MADPYDLQRFVDAQQGTHERAWTELATGRKTGHWMWFVFPQLAGLGTSAMAVRYAIGGRAEARAYLAHPGLGYRLRTCALTVVNSEWTAEQVLGGIDAVKLRSSMTLFLRAAPDEPLWQRVLDHWYGGSPDPATDTLLESA